MTKPRIPAVVIPATPPEQIITARIPEMTFDGQPFPFETVGEWTLKFTDDGVAVLNVSIPIRIAAEVES